MWLLTRTALSIAGEVLQLSGFAHLAMILDEAGLFDYKRPI